MKKFNINIVVLYSSIVGFVISFLLLINCGEEIKTYCGTIKLIEKEYYGKYNYSKNVAYLQLTTGEIEKFDIDNSTYILKKEGDEICITIKYFKKIGVLYVFLIICFLLLGLFSVIDFFMFRL